jgi:hypothetical protein
VASKSNRAVSRDQSCSVSAKRAGKDPIGSAWSVKTGVLVELPLPFAYNVLESRGVPVGLPDLGMELYGHDPGIGFIGIAPDAYWSRPGLRRVIIAYPPDGRRIVYKGRIEVTGEITHIHSSGDEPHTAKQYRIANLVRTEEQVEVALAR